MRHFVAMSGGKDSTALALRLAELHPDVDYEYFMTPTGNEFPELFEHVKLVEGLLGKSIEFLPAARTDLPEQGDRLLALIKIWGALPNFRQRWCTRVLKIEPAITFLTANAPCIQYVGLRADEESREGIYGEIPGVEQLYPMQDWGWGIDDVWAYLDSRGVKVPRRTDCAWCFYQRLPEWKMLWQTDPASWAIAEALEEETDHTFRSPQRDTWPAALKGLRLEWEGGRLLAGERDPAQQTLFDDDEYLEEDRYTQCRVCRL